MYRADYHVHTAFSPDSSAKMESQIQTAIKQGFNEIAITDHMEKDFIDKIGIFSLEIQCYKNALQELSQKYEDKIKVVHGLEIGYEKSYHLETLEKIKGYPFDFIICSMHRCDDCYLHTGEFFERKSQKQAYRRYFENVLESIEEYKDFQVYGHVDYIHRYGNYKEHVLEYATYKDIIDVILQKLIDTGRGLELNTSGIRYGLGQFHPQISIIKRYKEMGGEIITIGSDSHANNQLGFLWNEAAAFLKNVGFSYYTTFDKQKPNFYKL